MVAKPFVGKKKQLKASKYHENFDYDCIFRFSCDKAYYNSSVKHFLMLPMINRAI